MDPWILQVSSGSIVSPHTQKKLMSTCAAKREFKRRTTSDHTVDASEILHQLGWTIYRLLNLPGGWEWDF